VALTPISTTASLTGRANLQNLERPVQNMRTNQPSNENANKASVTSITENVETAKESSLLYQLISRLLLTPEQDQQLSNSLQQASDAKPLDSVDANSELEMTSELRINTNSEQFSLTIEVSVLRIEQQTLMVTDQSGQFIQQNTVFESINISLEVSVGIEQQESDPLVIDVNGDGFTTSGIEQGAIFDINADGSLDKVSMVTSDDALLALDINGNGIIDDGSELFGDQRGYENGFTYLASFDDNQDGSIDAKDQIFNSLLMMKLIDNEQFISKLSDTSIQSIDLGYGEISNNTASGDRIVQISDYKSSDGQTGRIADLLLKYKSGIDS